MSILSNLKPVIRAKNSGWDGTIDIGAVWADGSTNLLATLYDGVGEVLFRFVKGPDSKTLHRYKVFRHPKGWEQESPSWDRMVCDWYTKQTPEWARGNTFWPNRVARFRSVEEHPELLYSLENIYLQCGTCSKLVNCAIGKPLVV